MTARLATNVLVGAMMRKAQAEGGFAAVLAKGDADSGAIVVILTERGTDPRILERLLQPDGSYAWQSSTGLAIDNPALVPDFIARRRRSDPDLWVIELDIPSAKRFADEMIAFG